MSRLRIAIVTQFPVEPDKPVGGVEAVSVNLVRHLARDPTLEVHVLSLVNVTSTVETSWAGATLHFLPRPEGSMLRLAIDRGRKVVHAWLDANEMDLVHAHDTYGLMVQGYRGNRVFTVHGFIYGDTLVSGTRFARLRSWIWKQIETRGWADQPNVISISPYVRERVSAFSEANIRDIDNPVAAGFFDIPWVPEQGRIFSAATINPRKNTLRLVEAVHVLRQRGIAASLHLAGPIVEPAYGEKVKRYIATNNLGEHVRLLGSLPTPAVREELRSAAVFALVSLEENSPMGIEEAMAVGVPAVSSNRCGMPYMIRHGETGYLVDPHDPDNIADALARVIGDEPAMRSMGAAGRRVAQERFHPDVVAERTAAFYREIVPARKPVCHFPGARGRKPLAEGR
jgi:glycosyltransferase involved in cell wall biosynthesis